MIYPLSRPHPTSAHPKIGMTTASGGGVSDVWGWPLNSNSGQRNRTTLHTEMSDFISQSRSRRGGGNRIAPTLKGSQTYTALSSSASRTSELPAVIRQHGWGFVLRFVPCSVVASV